VNLSGKLLIGPVACALALALVAGCSSSGSDKTFPTTPPANTVVPESPAKAVNKPLTKAGCSLATSDQVKALLGGAAAPQELPSQPIYRACTWTGSGSSSGKFNLSVIRLGNGQVGFTYAKVEGLTSTAVSALGTRAVYLTGEVGGRANAILAADQGSVSVSLGVSWKGTLPNSDALKANLTTLIRGVFAQLG
jgi:Protein of unknown function (DUF3558)